MQNEEIGNFKLQDQPIKQTKQSFLKKHSVKLLILIIIILILSDLYLLRDNHKLRRSVSTLQVLPSPTISYSPLFTNNDFYSDVKLVFENFKETYKGELVEDKSSVWWISEDDLNIINDNSTGIKLYTFNCELGSNLNSDLIFKEIAQSIGAEIDKVMTQNGFRINEKNSSKSVDDDQFYDYAQAYENGSTKVVFTANPDCEANSNETPMHYTFSFGFTEDFDNNYQLQSPYLKDLNIKEAIIHVQKKVGDFSYLSVHLRRTGYYTIAKLINGRWTELFSGQDIPSCEIVEKYYIPKDIISDCY